ncbi:hypothetical protein EV361DRAFT_870763 [Lentinula raphanica]|nr:hypothetical protein EV361DRAFT_870763 [Lentinula raphanica]
MSRSPTASRALALLFLGAAISTSGILAAPTSIPSPWMSSHPSSNEAQDPQLQSAGGQAHSLFEGQKFKLPQTLHRGGVEHPNVVSLRRAGDDLPFVDSGELNDKDGIDPSTRTVSVPVKSQRDQDLRKRVDEPTHPTTNPQQRVAMSLAIQSANVKNRSGAKKLAKRLKKMYTDLINKWKDAEGREASILSLGRDAQEALYVEYMSTITEMVHAADKGRTFTRAWDLLSRDYNKLLTNCETLLSEFEVIELNIGAREDRSYYPMILLTLLERLHTIDEDTDKEEVQARRLEMARKYMRFAETNWNGVKYERLCENPDDKDTFPQLSLQRWCDVRNTFKQSLQRDEEKRRRGN